MMNFIIIFAAAKHDFSTSLSTISLASVGYIVKGLSCMICMIIIPVLCVKDYKKLPNKIRLILAVYFIQYGLSFYIYVFSELNSYGIVRYFVYEVVLAIMISAWYLHEHMMKPENLNRFVLIMAIGIFGIFSLFSIADSFKKGKESYQIKEGVISYLEKCDLKYGYATYWNAQLMVSMSNMDVKILPVTVADKIYPFWDNNFKHQFSVSNHEGESFLLLTDAEYEEIMNGNSVLLDIIGTPDDILSVNGYTILTFSYNIAEKMELQNGG